MPGAKERITFDQPVLGLVVSEGTPTTIEEQPHKKDKK